MTLLEVYDGFVLSKRLAGLSPKTLSCYQQFVMPFVEFVGADRDYASVSQADVNSYLGALLDRPLSKSSRATYVRHVKIFLRWAESEYGCASYSSKSVRVPKSPRRSVRIYTDEDVSLIFSVIHASPEWLSVRNKCVIALMYDSGLRQSEVCTLRRSRLSLSEGRMTVVGKGSKERIVPIGATSMALMREYFSLCPYESDEVFVGRRGDPLTCNAVKLFVSKVAASLPFEFSSHKLRHNFATNYCIDQYERYGQIDIYRLMYLMGHEDVETTGRYLHFAYEIMASRGCISHLDGISI